MKKRFHFMVSAAVIGMCAAFALVCGLALAACDKNDDDVLSAPENLRIENEYLIWDEVDGATGYTVEINGVEYTAQTNRLDILEITNKPVTYTMKALAEGRSLVDYSEWSEEIEYKVEAPINLEYKELEDGTYEVSAKLDEAARKEMTGKLIIPEVTGGSRIISSIAAAGFSKCQNITSVYIPDGIQKVGQQAFALCTSVNRVRLSPNSTDVSIGMFMGCVSLKEVNIPVGVTGVGRQAFGKCASLEKADLPDGLTMIGIDAFRECRSLKSLVLPDTVDKYEFVNLGPQFQDCNNLTHLEIKGGESEKYKSDGNCIIRKMDNAVVCGCVGSVIPGYVTKIDDYAFLRCAGLKEIEIPSNVKKIGESAFGYCEDLQTVSFPEGLEEVYSLAFENCSELESVYISSTVKKWRSRMMGYRMNVFPRCPELKTIVVSEDNPVFKSHSNCLIKKENNELVEGCVGSVIPSFVTRIGNYAFCECEALKEITIPDWVTEIGQYAFAFCHNVRGIYIPRSVTLIEEDAFSGCCIASLIKPEGVSIRSYDVCIYSIGVDPWFSTGSVLAYDGEYPYVYSVKCLINGYTFEQNPPGSTYSYQFGLIAPVRKGYTFLGWTTKEGSTQVEIFTQTHYWEHPCCNAKPHYGIRSHKATVTLPPENYDVNDGKTYYAVWQKNI